MAETPPDSEGMESLNLHDDSLEEEELEVRQAMAQQCFEDCHKYCYGCGSPDHLQKDCPQYKACMQSLSKKGGSHKGAQTPPTERKSKRKCRSQRATVRSARAEKKAPKLNPNALAQWIGKENLGWVTLEGQKTIALLDTGANVNTITPEYATALGLPIGSLTDLKRNEKIAIKIPGNLAVGPISYVIMRVQVDDVKGYDEYQVALVTPDNGHFARRMPIILGSPTTGRIVAVIKDSEIEKLSGPWAHTHYIVRYRVPEFPHSSATFNIIVGFHIQAFSQSSYKDHWVRVHVLHSAVNHAQCQPIGTLQA